jgi:uncharacterized protein YkvS
MSDMNIDTVAVLRQNITTLNSSFNRLQNTYNNCVRIGIKPGYTDEEFDSFEVMTSRYARTTDLLINKTLRSLDIVEFVDGGTIIDVVNRTAKRGIISDVTDLRNLKDLRNAIAHEYETEDIAAFFAAVLQAVPRLFETIKRLNTYCERHLGKIQ